MLTTIAMYRLTVKDLVIHIGINYSIKKKKPSQKERLNEIIELTERTMMDVNAIMQHEMDGVQKNRNKRIGTQAKLFDKQL